jgi:hypothetical protein
VSDLLTPQQRLFYQRRYDDTHHTHLRTVFTCRPDLRWLWLQNQHAGFNNFLARYHIIFKPFNPNYAAFLLSKIYHHKHLNPEDYPALKRYLENISDGVIKAEIKAFLDTELQRLQETFLAGEAGTQDDSKSGLRLQLQLALIRLIESSSSGVAEVGSDQEAACLKEQKKYIREATGYITKLQEGYEFRSDLYALITSFDRSRCALDLRESKGWQIVLTDHYWDLFMAGTDVAGSCQRVDGDPGLNQCLLAYVQDRKIKMIAIKDDKGRIIARRMMRLLWDEQGNTPVLFLEECYPPCSRSEQLQAMERFAIHIAEDLGVPLVVADSTENSARYPHSLGSLSGVWPEYVDAIHQLATKGEFTIHNSQMLVNPRIQPMFKPRSSYHFTWPGQESMETGQLVTTGGTLALRRECVMGALVLLGTLQQQRGVNLRLLTHEGYVAFMLLHHQFIHFTNPQRSQSGAQLRLASLSPALQEAGMGTIDHEMGHTARKDRDLVLVPATLRQAETLLSVTPFYTALVGADAGNTRLLRWPVLSALATQSASRTLTILIEDISCRGDQTKERDSKPLLWRYQQPRKCCLMDERVLRYTGLAKVPSL